MINEHYIPEAVILANGEYPAHELPLRLLAEAQFVVCCERGRQMNIFPADILPT